MFLFADYSPRSNNFICMYLIVCSVFEFSDNSRAIRIISSFPKERRQFPLSILILIPLNI